jgi:hypothetical protein
MSWFFVGAAVVAGVSSIAQSDAQRRAAHAQGDILRERAKVAQNQAFANEEAQRRTADQIIGQQRAAVTQSGFTADGTNLDLVKQSATNAELDALNIRYEGQLQAVGDIQQANLSNMAATDATQAGIYNAGASALSAYGGYKRSTAKLG